jgi:hypothetical protein
MQGEINTDNNFAQENVASFDSDSASSHRPVILEAEVRSPFSVLRKVDLARTQAPARVARCRRARLGVAGRERNATPCAR